MITDENNTPPELLKHYTTLEALESILRSGELRFGDPAGWSDKNDFVAVSAYRRKTGAEKIRVLCFAQSAEQIVHWYQYAKTDSGACIHFKTGPLTEVLQKGIRFLSGPVEYFSQSALTAAALRTFAPERLPFIKRRPYESEREYRVIWSGAADEAAPLLPVAGLIEYVTLAPGLAPPKGADIKQSLEGAYGLTVKYSRLMEDSEKWISKFNSL